MGKVPKFDDKAKDAIPELVVKSLSRNNADLSQLIEESLETEKKLARTERKDKSKSLEKTKVRKSL